MDARASALIAFADAIAAGHTKEFCSLVETARQAGAGYEELLVAVRVGRSLAVVPESVVSQAYHAVETGYGIAPGWPQAA